MGKREYKTVIRRGFFNKDDNPQKIEIFLLRNTNVVKCLLFIEVNFSPNNHKPAKILHELVRTQLDALVIFLILNRVDNGANEKLSLSRGENVKWLSPKTFFSLMQALQKIFCLWYGVCMSRACRL